jgi:chorismate mutase/prephenate dehydratase
MRIEMLRARIDAIDRKILHLLNGRLRLAIAIGELKRKDGLPLRIPQRERAVLTRMGKLNRGPLRDEAVGRLFRLIIRETRRVQESRVKRPMRRREPPGRSRSKKGVPR